MFEEDPDDEVQHEIGFYLDKMEEVKEEFTKRVAKYFGATKGINDLVMLVTDGYKEGYDEAERVGDLIGILPEEIYAVYGLKDEFIEEFNREYY